MKKALLPLLALLLLTPFFPWLDHASSAYYFDGESFEETSLQLALFRYGPFASYLCAAAGLLMVILNRYRREGAMLFLAVALGSGLLVNGILKPGWGRPRPRQLIEFGGLQEYRPYYKPNFSPPEPSLAFPSGHSSSGFYFFVLVPIGWQQRRRSLVVGGFALALLLGGSLSWTRIAMGGHSLSDTLWAGYVMWLVALGLGKLLIPKEQS